MNFLAKLLTEIINFCEARISLDKIIKSTNFQANKSPGNKNLIAELYKHFFNEVAPVLLDIYDSWGKFGTMCVSGRTGILPVTYKKGDKKYIIKYRYNNR